MAAGEKQRIDKWLFFARVTKSRALAAKLANAGRVKINDRTSSGADHAIGAGDVLDIHLERNVLVYKVTALGLRRGPAAEARLLYEDLTPAKSDTGHSIKDAVREPGTGRPEKKQRRALERMRSRIFDS